jgi:hypothetical protein
MLSRPILISLRDLDCDKKNTGENGFSSKKVQEKPKIYDMMYWDGPEM